MTVIPLEALLIVSAVMFFAGVFGFLSRRNMLTILISLELMLNAAHINFVAFNRFYTRLNWTVCFLHCLLLGCLLRKRLLLLPSLSISSEICVMSILTR